MYLSDFNLKIDTEELEQLLHNKVSEYLTEESIKMKEKIFDKVSSELETFMYERFDNVQEKYFREVSSFLLGSDHYRPDNKTKIKLNEWLKGLGNTQQEFRKKIYEENKEDILEQISYDSIYELVKNMYDNSYFKHWDFRHINKGYPQSVVARTFLGVLAEQKGFQDALDNTLDSKIKSKLEELDWLNRKIEKVKSELEEIDI